MPRRRIVSLVGWAAVTGVLTGLGVLAFERIVTELLDQVHDLPWWAVLPIPLVGLALAHVALTFVGRDTSPGTADEYLLAFHGRGADLGLRSLAARMLGAIATIGSGGAMGLEGPSILLGASTGSELEAKVPTAAAAGRRALLVAGAAAGVAAVFKAPATGAVFALEVPYRDGLARRELLPALVGAATGYLAFAAIDGTGTLLPTRGAPDIVFVDLLGALVLGVVCGFGAKAFAAAIRLAKRVTTMGHPAVRIVGAGVALAVFLASARATTGQDLTLGPGYDAVHWAITAHPSVALLLLILVLRCLATPTTVAGGGVGGLFVPLVVAGGIAGQTVATALDERQTTLFVIIGVAAFLGAGYRVPLAAVVFVAEVTGRPGYIIPGIIAAASRRSSWSVEGR